MSAQVILHGFGKKSGSGTGAVLTVNGVPGDNITITNGEKTYTGVFSNEGIAVFKGLTTGTWTAFMFNESQSIRRNIDINVEANLNLTYTKIYGISRVITNSSPQWARTDEAIGMTATASSGTIAGISDFDNCYPWSDIQRVTMETGDVMIKIPKFWYKRYQVTTAAKTTEYIKIASGPAEGFNLHPAFYHSEIESDCIYVGAYTASLETIDGIDTFYSKSGKTVYHGKTKDESRTIAQSKGKGWGLLDISTLSAIQMLILVEFASNNVQEKIGKGLTASTREYPYESGGADTVLNLTGQLTGSPGYIEVIWRGIEALWGNVEEIIDGIIVCDYGLLISNYPAYYGNIRAYHTIYQTFKEQEIYTTYLLYDSNYSYLLFPLNDTTGGSTATYFCDASDMYCIDVNIFDYVTVYFGGHRGDGDKCGLFRFYTEPGGSEKLYGCRLMYIPQEEE